MCSSYLVYVDLYNSRYVIYLLMLVWVCYIIPFLLYFLHSYLLHPSIRFHIRVFTFLIFHYEPLLVQPFFIVGNHVALGAGMLYWQQPFCIGGSHVALGATILYWWQPFCISTTTLVVFACLGFLSPANRGFLMTCAVVCYVLMGTPAGYSSARIYKMFGGEKWKSNVLLTAFLVPG